MCEVARRLAVGALLLSALLAMTVHYGAVDDRNDPAAVGIGMVEHHEAHVGETIFFWGRVVGPDSDALRVRASSRTLRVLTDRTPPAGSAIQVYGRLEPGGVVDPDRVIVSQSANLRSLYAVSAVGALLAAGAFLRTWSVDRGSHAFVPRGEDDA